MTLKPIKTIKVRSQTDKNIIYDVRFYEDGSATCSCPAFWFSGHKKGLGQCKHISVAKKYFNK